jgi:UrcA family protein
MITLTTTIRRSALAALMLSSALTAAAAEPELGGHVTVRADRPTTEVIGQSRIGVPIMRVELSAAVNHSDLDLSIPSNAKVLKTRVRDAAHLVCADIEKLYQVSDSTETCASKAAQSAMKEADKAIAAAQERRSVAETQ